MMVIQLTDTCGRVIIAETTLLTIRAEDGDMAMLQDGQLLPRAPARGRTHCLLQMNQQEPVGLCRRFARDL